MAACWKVTLCSTAHLGVCEAHHMGLTVGPVLGIECVVVSACAGDVVLWLGGVVGCGACCVVLQAPTSCSQDQNSFLLPVAVALRHVCCLLALLLMMIRHVSLLGALAVPSVGEQVG